MAPKSKMELEHESKKRCNRESEEYRLQRKRNNIAVKKSREKSRSKFLETSIRVEKLKKENDELEGRVNVLTKELSLLKELLLSSAGKRKKPENTENQAAKSANSQYQTLDQMPMFTQVVLADDI